MPRSPEPYFHNEVGHDAAHDRGAGDGRHKNGQRVREKRRVEQSCAEADERCTKDVCSAASETVLNEPGDRSPKCRRWSRRNATLSTREAP